MVQAFEGEPSEELSRQRPAPVPTERQSRKTREGKVVSVAMDKTVVVVITQRASHRRYKKTVQRTSRLYAHDEHNAARPGDRVRLAETRPLSRTKRWRVAEVIERAR